MPDAKNRRFKLVDDAADPATSPEGTWNWNGNADLAGSRSLLRYCDDHGERLKRKYCHWVHELGNARVGGRSLIELLEVEPGLSYWWLTLLTERSLWKSPGIHDAIRLLALEEILMAERPEHLLLVSGSRRLHRAVQHLCGQLGIAYAWQQQTGETRSWSVRRLYDGLPQLVHGGLALIRHVWARRGFTGHREAGSWFSQPGTVFFCSYFFNVAPEQAERGHFHSRYWNELQALLRREGRPTNWLQIYYPHPAVSTPEAALRWTGRFNQRREEEGVHAFVDAYFSCGIILRVLRRWLWLAWTSWRLGKLEREFQPGGSHVSFWPILQDDWGASFRGATAIKNLLWIYLFDAALRVLPRQEQGFYLCESQGWERAFLHAWRKHGHGELMAVPHSTRSFWDLRFFREPGDLDGTQSCPMPHPAKVAVNGPAAREMFLQENYPAGSLYPCEALRYGYLEKLARNRTTRREASRRRSEPGIRVLVLGDYLPATTAAMLQALARATSLFPARISFTVKPHPNCPVHPRDFPGFALQVVTAPLGNILLEYDVAYSSNATSAAVDAYLAGLHVVILLEPGRLNLSPLRGCPGVRFVAGPGELASALEVGTPSALPDSASREIFFFDAALPRWAHILGHGPN